MENTKSISFHKNLDPIFVKKKSYCDCDGCTQARKRYVTYHGVQDKPYDRVKKRNEKITIKKFIRTVLKFN